MNQMDKVVLHRTGWEKWPEYNAYHNGHHYEIVKYPGADIWTVTMDGEQQDGSYWLKEIRESIAEGDYEN